MTPNAMATLSGPILQFFEALDQHTDAVPVDVLQRELEKLNITAADIEPFIAFSEEHYQRNRMHVGPAYHALTLCWLPGQASPIHDHEGSGCGVYVVQGSLHEIKYERQADGTLVPIASHDLHEGQVCASYDADTHVIRNDSDTPLVTMHIYTPPLRACKTFSCDCAEIGRWEDPWFAANP